MAFAVMFLSDVKLNTAATLYIIRLNLVHTSGASGSGSLIAGAISIKLISAQGSLFLTSFKLSMSMHQH